MKSKLNCVVVLLALAGGLSTPAWAQTPAPSVPVAKSQNGIAYIQGGVGTDEQAAMRAMRGEYNLYLTFSNRNGEFQAGAQVDIWDTKGVQRLSVSNAGPMLFARLAPGSYKVVATAEGRRFERPVTVGTQGGKELVFTWGAAEE